MTNRHPTIDELLDQCDQHNSRCEYFDGDHVFQLNVGRVDALACELLAITMKPRSSSQPLVDWRKLGTEIASRVRYLPEPLTVVESDALSETTQIRSAPPASEDGRPAYFECLASTHGISLHRYRQSNEGREETPYCLTREQLRRLLCDLSSAVRSAHSQSVAG